MASTKAVLGVIIAATFAAVLFVPFYDTVTDTAGQQSVTNETLTADPGTYQDLDGYRVVDASETVWWQDTAGGTYEQVSTGNYSMNNSDGSISISTGSSVDAGDALKVSYDYQSTDENTATILNLAPLLVALLILVVIATKVTDMV